LVAICDSILKRIRKNFEDLDMLAAILNVLGIQSVSIDDNFSLQISDSVYVNLHWHASTRHLILFSEIAELGQLNVSIDLLKILMEANCFWSGTSGATLCIEKEKNQLLLIHKIFVDEQCISDERLRIFFEAFFNAAVFWKEKLYVGDNQKREERAVFGKENLKVESHSNHYIHNESQVSLSKSMMYRV
jgi:Tir chaperone protein (CesT) family